MGSWVSEQVAVLLPHLAVAVVWNYYVVQERDTQQEARLYEALGDVPIFGARRRISTRVIVSGEDGTGADALRGIQEPAGMDQGSGRGPDAGDLMANEPVANVQADYDEVLNGIAVDRLSERAGHAIESAKARR